ncbi:hypothetical protein [Facilibium subflavum]|uniref:hypothetical protein n=1 Tax=Facilibium subflavum TaxID=2219058 RepID=UPI000E64848E|nr:hypothetical protein [Facilibium subflavum]
MEQIIHAHRFVWPKYACQIEKLCKPFCQKFHVEGLTLTTVDQNGEVFDLVLRKNEGIEIYQSQNYFQFERLHYYQNLLRMPKQFEEIPFHTIIKDTMKQSLIIPKNALYRTMINIDGSISKLSIVPEFENIIPYYKYNQYTFDCFIQTLNEALPQTLGLNHEAFRAHPGEQPQPLPLNNPSGFSWYKWTDLEKKVLLCLYHGIISSKQLGHKLNKSTRTCEDYIERIKQKLNKNTKDELLIYLHQNYRFIYQSLIN